MLSATLSRSGNGPPEAGVRGGPAAASAGAQGEEGFFVGLCLVFGGRAVSACATGSGSHDYNM